MHWFIVGGSVLASILAAVNFFIAIRRKAIFGTESHPLRDLSNLTSTEATSEPIFGTESEPVRDLSELTPIEANTTEYEHEGLLR